MTFLVFLLTLNIFHTFFSVSIVDFEQINASWGYWYENTLDSQLDHNRMFDLLNPNI